MYTIEKALEEVHQYFEFNGIDVSNSKLNLESMASFHQLTLHQITVLMCNLESEEIMQDLVDGELYSFDPEAESDFNDGYH